MYPNRLTHRVIVCLAGAIALVIVGNRIFAADSETEKKKPAESLQLEPATTTQPAPGEKFVVVSVQTRALFERFKGKEQIEKKYMDLQKQAQAAQGDQQKMGELRMQMQKMQGDMRKSISDALTVVAKRENYDIVVGDVANLMYKSETTNIPDITDAVVEQLNSATTLPADDSAETKPADEDVAEEDDEKKLDGEK